MLKTHLDVNEITCRHGLILPNKQPKPLEKQLDQSS